MAFSLRDIGFTLGYELDKQSEAQVEQSIQGLKNMATKLLGAIGIGFSLTQINAITEEFRTVNRAIQSSVAGMGDVAEAQQAILDAANESRTSYAAMADTVSDLVKSSADLFPVQDAVNFSSTVTKLLKTYGRGDQEIQSMMDGLNKSFQKGIVDTETLNVMLEQCPEAANLLADSLGTTKDKLLDMASNGKISLQQLKDAFLNSADEIDEAFNNMDLSITEAILNVRNSWGFMLADFDETFGVTNAIARTIVRLSNMALGVIDRIRNRLLWLADRLGGTDQLLKLIAISAGAIFLALNAGKIMSFLSGVTKILNLHTLKVMAVVAAIVLLALLVEDFFAFVKGENSLIGTLLEKAGVDTDALRDTIRGLWEQIKDVIDVLKQMGRTVGGQLLSAIKQILPELGRLAASILPIIVDLVKSVMTFVVRLASTALPQIVNLISTLLPYLFDIVSAILPVIIDLIAQVLPFLSQIIDALLPVIISLIETLLPLIMQIIDAVLPVILELIQAIVPLLVTIVESLLPVVLSLFEALLPLITPIVELIANIVQALLPPLITMLEAILPILEPILGVLQPIADILGVIINAISKVVGWVSSGLGWIVDKIFGGGADTSGAEAVNAYAEGTDNSSDTFIAGEEGPELVTGQKGKKVFTALETGKIFQAMAMLGKAATAQPSTITNSSSTRTINQYNEFVNTFNGEKTGQKKSAEAMSRSSDDAVTVMARALQFAR